MGCSVQENVPSSTAEGTSTLSTEEGRGPASCKMAHNHTIYIVTRKCPELKSKADIMPLSPNFQMFDHTGCGAFSSLPVLVR